MIITGPAVAILEYLFGIDERASDRGLLKSQPQAIKAGGLTSKAYAAAGIPLPGSARAPAGTEFRNGARLIKTTAR
jgi:hypothetical protein